MSEENNNTDADVLIDDPDVLLRQAREPLVQAKDRLEAQANEMASELAVVNEKIKRINRTLSTLEPQSKAKARQRPSSGTGASAIQVSQATVAKVFDTLKQRGEGTITEIAEELGISPPSVSAAFRELRAHEQIRLAGRKGMSQLFKPFDEKAEYDKPMTDPVTDKAEAAS